MTIGTIIASNRKKLGLTQEALAQQLGVTNQAVSKWELDQSCPDILLLPRIADIFGITVDELFGREVPKAESVVLPAEPVYIPKEPELPWPDDGTLRVVIYKGHTYVASCPEQETITFEYTGPALNIHCAVNLNCEDVGGDVHAEGNVNCDAVSGNVQAGGNVACDEVEGNIYAGGNVICDEIGGNATAGGSVSSDGENEGHIHFSIGGKNKKKHQTHISMEGTDVDVDAAEKVLDEDIEDTIGNKIDKFVNNIIRMSTDFRF